MSAPSAGALCGPVEQWVDELTDLAVTYGPTRSCRGQRAKISCGGSPLQPRHLASRIAGCRF
jgi:hypothetical protein